MNIQMEDDISIIRTLDMIHVFFVGFDFFFLVIFKTKLIVGFVIGWCNPTDTVWILPSLFHGDLDSTFVIDSYDGDSIEIERNIWIFVQNVDTGMSVGRTRKVCFRRGCR